jgi:DNA polymerase-3 subunit delta
VIPFAAELQRKEIAPIYALVSSEPLLVRRALAAIRAAVLDESTAAWNHDVFEGKGASGAAIRAAADTLPMMGDRRLVEVRNAQQMAASELVALVPFVDSPNPRATLVLSATKVDKRVKLYARLRKAGYLHELSAPRAIRKWLDAEASSAGVSIDRAAGSRLIEVVGNDVSRLSVALEMLSLYAGGETVRTEHVDDLIAHTRESSVFELTDAIAAGDRVRALETIASLADQRQSTLGVVMMLARHVRQLCRTRLLMTDGASSRQIASALKVPPFVADKLTAQARRYRLRGLFRALNRLSAADRAIKGQEMKMRTLGRALGERVLLEALADELIALGR